MQHRLILMHIRGSYDYRLELVRHPRVNARMGNLVPLQISDHVSRSINNHLNLLAMHR